jgi:hypothetical protein
MVWVNLSIDARFHFEAVCSFVEGVRHLGIVGIGDRLYRDIDRLELVIAKLSASVAALVLVTEDPNVASGATGFADERGRLGLHGP